MKKYLFLLILTAILILPTYHLADASENSSELYYDLSVDSFNLQPEGFNDFFNEYFISTHTPHHNGYDRIYNSTDSQIIEGKFQYGDIRKDLEGEWVSIYLWSFSDEEPTWTQIGRQKTDSDGRISYTISEDQILGNGLHLIKLHVEGDATFANMFINVIDQGEKFVVFDIDGTLTTDDFESVKEYADEFFSETYRAEMYTSANEVVDYYVEQGYSIIYLTARPYWLSEVSQRWLVDNSFPHGTLHTYPGATFTEDAAGYKENYLSDVLSSGGMIDFAYGNALTDIEAYFSVGLNRDRIFIIGENAGIEGTTPVNNYPDHLMTLIEN
ncbi:LNS2 domain-containing protein [Chengkuizengella marina]|uniref:Lipin LNS2 n=1 Tax=Chengkuizengella marina TaxID=2507566 RepID=A0A6N9PZC3_9BACL|nr:HAD family acid phosphatase [Chengkuizengella marina]NBI27965.1 lipin LNS2 [Chengkuizengella marina]